MSDLKLTDRGEMVANILACIGIVVAVASFSLIAYLIGA